MDGHTGAPALDRTPLTGRLTVTNRLTCGQPGPLHGRTRTPSEKLAGGFDSHKDHDVRQAVAGPLTLLATALDAAVLLDICPRSTARPRPSCSTASGHAA